MSDFRRYHRDLHIRLGASTDQLRQLLVDLRRLIYSHPRLTERAARVRFEEILRDGYSISLNCYVDSSAYSEFLAVAEDLNLRILQILEDNGVHLAVPVQQWVNNSEDSTATVQRSQDEVLPFPDFSKDDKAAMKGSLDYPYRG